MDNGKPIILEPNTQQFPFLPVRSQQGHVINAGQVVNPSHMTTVRSQQGHVINAGQVVNPSHMTTVSGNKVIVVSSLEELKHLQSSGQSGSHVVQSTGHIVQGAGDGHLQQQRGYETQLSGGNQHGAIDNSINKQTGSEVAQEEEVPEVNIAVNNVVCSFSCRCHVNLKRLAMEGVNVIFKRENNVVNMKLRNPRVTANIWSSGKITCTGATSEEDSKKAARRVARILQNQGYRVRFSNFRVVNVLGTCSFPWGIKLNSFAKAYPKETSYEPELHPGATYRIKEPKASLKVFSTGSITITAPCVANVQSAVEHIFPLVYPYRLVKEKLDPQEVKRLQGYMERNPQAGAAANRNNFKQKFVYNRDRHLIDESDDDEESYGSDSDSS